MDTITQSYTGADATGEILVMLAVAFCLGYLLRWAWEKFMYVDMYRDYSVPVSVHTATEETKPTHTTTYTENNITTTNTENMVVPMPQQTTAMPYKQDDLKMVEGIGPKIESLLQDAGIVSWRDLANTEVSRLREILNSAGERYRIHDPSTWPEQSRLAFENKWSELEEYQNFLSGGKMIG